MRFGEAIEEDVDFVLVDPPQKSHRNSANDISDH